MAKTRYSKSLRWGMSSIWAATAGGRVELRPGQNCGKLALSCSVASDLMARRLGLCAGAAVARAGVSGGAARGELTLASTVANQDRPGLPALHSAELRRHVRRRRGPHELRRVRQPAGRGLRLGRRCACPSRSPTSSRNGPPQRSALLQRRVAVSRAAAVRPVRARCVTVGEGQTLLHHVRRRGRVRRRASRAACTCNTRG